MNNHRWPSRTNRKYGCDFSFCLLMLIRQSFVIGSLFDVLKALKKKKKILFCRFYCTVCLTFRACDAVFLLCPHAKCTDWICLKKDIYRSPPHPHHHHPFVWLKDSHRSGQRRSERTQLCSTDGMLWIQQEARLTPFPCAEGGEACRVGLCVAPVNAPAAGACAWCFSVPAGAREDLLQLWRTLRSAPKLQGVQTARAEAEKPVHVQRVRVQMSYVHMLYEHWHFCRTLKVMWRSSPSPAGCVETGEIYILTNSYLSWLWAHKVDATHWHRVELRSYLGKLHSNMDIVVTVHGIAPCWSQ